MIERRQILSSIVVAFLIEVALLFVLAVLFGGKVADATVAAVDDRIEEVTVLDLVAPPVASVAAPTPPPEPKRREQLPFVLVDRPDAPEAAPKLPTPFISEAASRAASAAPAALADGPPLPTQDGIRAPGFELKDQSFRDGEAVASAGAPGRPGEAGVEAPASEVAKVDEPKIEPTQPVEPPVESAPREESPDVVLLPSELPRMDVPTPGEDLRQRRSVSRTDALPARPPPGDGGGNGSPGFRSESRKRAIEGTISQAGKTSLDVADNALGRYMAAVSRVVERNWQNECRENRSMVRPGFLRVHFVIGADGRVRSAEVTDERDGGVAQRGFTVKVVRNGRFPAIPREVLDGLPDGELHVNFSFLFFL